MPSVAARLVGPLRRPPARPLAAAAAALLLAGCGPGLAPLPPTPVRAPAADSARTPAPAFAWAAGDRRFVLRTRAAITVAGDTAEARDTVTTTTHVTLRIAAGAPPSPRRLAGTVDSVRVAAGSRVPAVPADVRFPVPFEGTVDGGRVTLARAAAPPAGSANPCEGVAPSEAILAGVRDLLPSVPASLAAGARWEETTSATACRGGVAITTTAAHRYQVTGPGTWNGQAATRIERTSSYTVNGAGEQGGEQVSATGRGTGTATLFVDAAAGRLLGTTARSTLELTFVGGGQQQRVLQSAETEVREVGSR